MRVTLTTLFLILCILQIEAILLPFPKHQNLLNTISQIAQTTAIQKQTANVQNTTIAQSIIEQCPQGQIMGPNGCLNLIMTFPKQVKKQSSQSKILSSQEQITKNDVSEIIATDQQTEVAPIVSVINFDTNINESPETVLTENVQTAVQNKAEQNILLTPQPLLNISTTASIEEIRKIEQNQVKEDELLTTELPLNTQSSIDVSKGVETNIVNVTSYSNLKPLTTYTIPSFVFRRSSIFRPRFISLPTQVNSSICQGVWIQSLESCIPSVCPQKYEWNQQTQQCQMPKPKCKQGLNWNGKYCSPLSIVEKEFPKLNQTQQFARQASMKCAGNYCRYPVCPPKFTFIESTCLPTQKDVKCPKQNINHKGFCDPSYYLTIQNSCETWNGTICQQKYWNKY